MNTLLEQISWVATLFEHNAFYGTDLFAVRVIDIGSFHLIAANQIIALSGFIRSGRRHSCNSVNYLAGKHLSGS